MSKIFRLYKEGASTFTDWNESPSFPYNSNNRDNIEDPDGASARHEITSIPSPFARIDLVKNAFKMVTTPDKKNRQVDLDGKTIFHKMVSDALDVGEIFFNIDKFKNKIEIIPWDAALMINELSQSGIDGHHFLGDALGKYMQSDSQAYNFGNLRNVYLLNFLQGPDELNIIGATSPATVFFSNANALDYVSESLNFGQSSPFDDDYYPLYKRDSEYIKFWFALRKSIPDFATRFPEVEEYLSLTMRAITDNALKAKLRALTETDIRLFSEIAVRGEGKDDTVEVLGYPLLKRTVVNNGSESDFIIDTNKEVDVLPLVLPVDSGNRYRDMFYTTDTWGKTNAAPYVVEEQDLNKRELPFDGSVRAFITIGDLMHDNLVRVPHKLNNKEYFDGSIQLGDEKVSYLLPLKPLFFRYFSVENLMKPMADGAPMFEMERLAGGSVRATLRIPVKSQSRNKYIEYSRNFYDENEANPQQNVGGMRTFDFAGFIMPLIRFNHENDAYYTVSCISTYSRSYTLKFFEDDQQLPDVIMDCRNQSRAANYKAENYTIEKRVFDHIEVTDAEGVTAVIIPLFKQQQNINTFDFSIDLGTSNTHIEYRVNNAPTSQTFSYEQSAKPYSEFFTPSMIQFNGKKLQDDLLAEQSLMERDFLPQAVSAESDYHFPTRTVLSTAQITKWHEVVRPYGMVNIPLTYDKRESYLYNRNIYNIKWGKGEMLRVMESYVETLMLMLRNKVLTEQGDLKRVNITWFYPISMAPKRLKKLRETWNNAYQKYFGNAQTTNMSESAAPIQYFFRRYANATHLVNIDIGGGTTDIAFARDKKIEYVTSCKFAANSVFENPYSDVDMTNGIVDCHKAEILKVLTENKLTELLSIFNSENNIQPSNMASFLFTLKENSMVRGIDSKYVDFKHMLQDDENFKIVFILFYTAIIYHVAEILKAKNLDLPRHISFSGNGSKLITVITDDSKQLADFTKLIIERVVGRPYDKDLEILGFESGANPKESTCKGGLLGENNDDDRDKIIVKKAFGDGFIGKDDTYDNLDDEYIRQSTESVEKFFDFVLNELNEAYDFDDNFGVSRQSVQIAREVCHKDVETYLRKGIMQRREESEGENQLEETVFFYPVKGILHELSNAIYQSIQ